MVDQGKSAFGFDQSAVDAWDAREAGHALRQVLARVGKLSRTTGNDEQIREQIIDEPDALAGLEHVKTMLRDPARSGSSSTR